MLRAAQLVASVVVVPPDQVEKCRSSVHVRIDDMF